jgi:hypothetical protein
MVSCDEILQRIYSLPKRNIWASLVVRSEQLNIALEELEETLPIFIDGDFRALEVTLDLEDLIRKVREADDYVLLWNFEQWGIQQWQEFDYDRSRFDRPNGGILLLTPSSANAFQKYAPNFASWVGSKVYDIELGTEILSEEALQQRLETLQAWSQKTNDEIIQLAEAGQLIVDPVYSEWLVLLGRGDLVER